MGTYVAQRVTKLLAASGKPPPQGARRNPRLHVQGEPPDIRNSKVIDIHMELRKLGAEPIVHDPMADPDDLNRAYGIEMEAIDEFAGLSALILAVPHAKFDSITGENISGMIEHGGVFIDVKSCVNPASLRSDITYWSL